jgi:hypothetical protein
MLHRNNRMTRLITAALAIAAIAPAAAVAQPIDQTGAHAGTSYGDTPAATAPQAPDRRGLLWQRCGNGCAHGGTRYGGTAAAAPQSLANPKPIGRAKATAATQSSDDGGLDTGIWVAIGGAAAVAAAGLGLAGRKRLRTTP